MIRVPTIEDYLTREAHPLRQTGGCRRPGRGKDNLQMPLITVVTIVRNRQETLQQTITSVLDQSYKNIEYIIVDGASTDGTLEVIKKFDDKIDLWVSEPDSGTSDAFNKAISMAEGDFIFGLSSDDWIEPSFIEAAAEIISNTGADFIFGDMLMHDGQNSGKVYKGNPDYAKAIMSGWAYCFFPTMVIRRKCFQEIGLIDLAYKFVNDYDLVLRLHLNGAIGCYNNLLFVHRRVGGIGECYPVQSMLEHLRLLRKYRLPKSKAMCAYLYFFVRRGLGKLAKLIMPRAIYKTLKRVASGG
ncbi:MAG: glycosyltransferase [Candidatus Omnitrophica bacterium]|jgi:glycosyltransferase involved in cell wall biosynthesis|nr:glycosyltransferase [Candidatus Omnitrophota bacterium]